MFLGPKTQISVALSLNDPKIQAIFADKLLASFSIEVRWSRKSGERFKHGFRTLGLNEKQKSFVLDLLERYNSRQKL